MGTIDMAEFSHDKAISMMVGRTLKQMYTCTHEVQDDEILKIENLKIAPHTEPINLTVRKGEVVGIGGLVGAGRTELAKSIFGARKYYGGSVIYQGREIKNPVPKQMIKEGLMYLTEDRKIEGLTLRMDIEKNITLASLSTLFKNTCIRPRVEKEISARMVKELNIVCSSPRQIANTLSGGNQQKVVLGKWLASSPKLLILDEPTRGIDVNAKSEIYQIIDRLASQGVAILMISSELPELIGMSDRIYVMRRGTVSAEITEREDFKQETILSYTV